MLKNRLPIDPHTHNSYTERTEVESTLICYFYKICIMLQNGQVVEFKRHPKMKIDFKLSFFKNSWESILKERSILIMYVDTENWLF